MFNSFRGLLEALRGFDVDVYVHAFNERDILKADIALGLAGRRDLPRLLSENFF
jgi:hypothetical protein